VMCLHNSMGFRIKHDSFSVFAYIVRLALCSERKKPW
jgi:hypothetical protein